MEYTIKVGKDPAYKESYYNKQRKEIFSLIPESAKRILDVGCGEGVFGGDIKKNMEVEIWGIERNEVACVRAADKLDKVLCGDVADIVKELPERYFDCIVFNDVLEHLTDPQDILLRIKGKLNSRGVVICSVPNIRYFYVLRDLLINKDWKYVDDGILDRTHRWFFAKKNMEEMFKNTGYDLIREKGINPTGSMKIKLLNIILFGFLSDTIYMQYAFILKPMKNQIKIEVIEK